MSSHEGSDIPAGTDGRPVLTGVTVGAHVAEEAIVGCADTIVALSTAVGVGAIGIVRLSGPRAVELVNSVFVPARGAPIQLVESHRLSYGHVMDPLAGEVVDEVLVAVMRKPRTYTREDVVEVHCHGGVVAQRAILRLMVQQGARLAQPGEFTRRAFLSGRIDLAQAESVAAVVAARSLGALRASVRQLDGGLSERLRSARGRLVGVLARIEATVDFSDDDSDEVDWATVVVDLTSAQDDLLRLLRTAFIGRALEQGVRTAIVGQPNVGKSSLLNALLMRERAIVSDIPGTTRDTVEELMEIGGVPIHLVDTAGLRSGGDDVERLGVERSLRAIDQADLVLAVVDVAAPFSEADRQLVAKLTPGRSIVVANKRDLVGEWRKQTQQLAGFLGTAWAREGLSAGGSLPGEGGAGVLPIVAVSALGGEGVDELRQAIQLTVTGGEGIHLEEPILASERQRSLVSEAADSCGLALEGARQRVGEELVCEDVRSAIQAVGRITGEELTPDMLDEIFSKFCIGK